MPADLRQMPPWSLGMVALWQEWHAFVCLSASKVDRHHDTDCQQDKDSDDDGEQGQSDPDVGSLGPYA